MYGDFCPVFDSESESGEIFNFGGSRQEKIGDLRLRDHFDGHVDCGCGSELDFAGWMES